MAKKRTSATGELFFVNLRDPIDLRREILESSKGVIEGLQRFEQFKRIREEKVENLSKLRDIVKDCTRLMNKLRTSLPSTNLKAEEVLQLRERPLGESIALPKKGKRSANKKIAERTELEKLDDELGDIERKLNAVS